MNTKLRRFSSVFAGAARAAAARAGATWAATARAATALAAVAVMAIMIMQPAQAADKPLKVGVTAGPHAQIFEVVKQEAAKAGLDIQIIEFNDYVQPNAALAAGDLDANSYQHQPYLDNVNADRGYKLVSIAKTVIFPIGIYSKKIKSLDQLKDGALVAIPNDPTNGARGLLLLQSKGLITLSASSGLKATPIDIVGNPKHLKFIELDAAQLPRSLDDTDASAVNTNFALEAGLNPKDAIAQESPNSPYANVIVVRAKDKDRPEFAKLVAAYHSQAVKDFIATKFKGSVVAAW
jgi:D-methionine transport system substrate-binding protein